MKYTVTDIQKMEKRLDKIDKVRGEGFDEDMLLPSMLMVGVGGAATAEVLSAAGPVWATVLGAGVAVVGAAKFARVVFSEQISDRLRQKIASANQELQQEMYSKAR